MFPSIILTIGMGMNWFINILGNNLGKIFVSLISVLLLIVGISSTFFNPLWFNKSSWREAGYNIKKHLTL